MLEENDGAGNTFKATAKPVLIGTAVVGATTMIFSIILFLAQNLAGEAPLTDLAQVRSDLGEYDSAEALYREALTSMQASLGEAIRLR